MAKIEFSADEKTAMGQKIKRYFQQELDQDIGQFDAEFFIDFIAKEIGPYIYNRGLYDAQAIMQERMDSIAEAIYDVEKPTDIR